MTAHYDRVHALCRRMLGNDADALDATQDALVAAIRGLSRFDGRSSFGTWLYRVATNTCLDELRRRRRRPVTGIAYDVAEVADELSSEVPGPFAVPARRGAGPDRSGRAGGSRDPADVVAARLDVDAALALLPIEFRTAVVLRDVCDLPYDEIAAVLDVPVGTVRSRIARARSALAAALKPEARSISDQAARDGTGNRTGWPDVKTHESERARAPDASGPAQRHGRRPGQATDQPHQEERTP